LPLVDRDGLTKPLIQLIAEEALEAGISEICIVVSPGDEQRFRRYFRSMRKDLLPAFAGKEWALKESEKLSRIEKALTFVVQEKPEGYGHAVYQARAFVGDEHFLLLLGDHIYISSSDDRCARQLLDAHHRSGAEAISAVQPTPANLLHSFGTMRGTALDASGRLFHVSAIKEKPSVEYARRHLITQGIAVGHYLCHFGMHVFPPMLFECIEQDIRDNVRAGGEIQLTTAQERMRSRLSRYYCYVVLGERYDAGVPFGLMEGQFALALAGVHRDEIMASLARLMAQQRRTP
jgi:UTP--glucose-1-phosphate uridylyltransferase